MDLTTKVISSSDEDLKVSSSNEELGRSEVQASCSKNSHVGTGAAGSAKVQVDIGQPAEEYPARKTFVVDGEIVNQDTIFWSLKKLKNFVYLKNRESRLYRCLVSYNEVQGICEASNMEQAKNGAAVDLLGKLSKEFSNLDRFPKKVWNTIVSILYGNLLKDTCPIYPAYLGVEQCSHNESLFSCLEWHMIHDYDSDPDFF